MYYYLPSCQVAEVPTCSAEDEKAHKEKCKALIDDDGVFADCMGKLNAVVIKFSYFSSDKKLIVTLMLPKHMKNRPPLHVSFNSSAVR